MQPSTKPLLWENEEGQKKKTRTNITGRDTDLRRDQPKKSEQARAHSQQQQKGEKKKRSEISTKGDNKARDSPQT